ncbi:MAG: helix-turn-helix domain-containing protein [Pseudoflavonifractor sp.]|nr:helix-turn-helix domain-containing protein [Pseudoflavonifractor sp.]
MEKVSPVPVIDPCLNEVVVRPQDDGLQIATFNSIADIPSFDMPAKLQVILSAVCIGGEMSAVIDCHEWRLRANDMIVLRPGHVITSYTTSDDFKGLFIVADPHAVYEALPSLSSFLHCALQFRDNPVIRISEAEIESQLTYHGILRRKIESASHQFRREVIKSLCQALFYETLGLYTRHMRDDIGPMKRKDDILLKFMTLVARDFRRERSVSYYAEQLCVTPKHLSAVVKDASGRTAGEWIDSHVALEAKILLKNTGMTIQEISTALNFANQSFFGKYFKHLTGMSPREYRISTDS